ncbi:DUF5753 domain-containing protein [Streptomyces lydicus]|uniref:DUF5753 domain-containing protein n=1 Tax=Streptomyces lydicus TaxID=47763 RepID=UPI0037A23DE2
MLDLPRDSLTNLLRILDQDTVRDYAKPYLARQDKAEMIHTAAFIVPGLLQTPDYVRELLLSGQAGDPTDIERFVDQRMERQQVWSWPNPPWLSAVLDESVLFKSTHKQLERLLEAQQDPRITLRILPFRAGQLFGTTTILTMSNGTRSAYTEGFSTGNFTEDSETVLRFQRVYDRLAASSITAEASTDRIHEALKRLT